MNEETIIKEFIKDEIKSFNDEDRLTVKLIDSFRLILISYYLKDGKLISWVINFDDINFDEDEYKSFKRTFLIDKMTDNK